MKRIILSLLTCGMLAGAFAQIEISKKSKTEVSDKWVITPVSTMKGVLGRLDINFPADVERNILIYQQADNKFLRSVSYNDKIYSIAPGEYRFTLTNVPVDNVPIKKGHETRLKMGFLSVVSEGDWHLFNETKDKQYTSGNKPKKIPLPVGSYQVKLGGEFYPVIIKDGETVEDYSPAEVKENNPVKIKDSGMPISDNNISAVFLSIDAEQYTMTRVPTGEDTSMQTRGRLATKFPLASSDAFLPVIRLLAIFRAGESTNPIVTCEVTGGSNYINCQASYTLDEGVYDVHFKGDTYVSGTSAFKVPNVSIRKGYETRLKVGYLEHSARGLYMLYDESKQWAYLRYNSQGSARHPIPIGNYWIKLFFVGEFPVQIKEGEVSVVKPPDYEPKSKTITSIILKDEKLNSIYGRLNTSFPEDTSLSISIRVPNSNSNSGYTIINLDTVKTYDLLPGNYTVFLNKMPIDVAIQTGHQTRIRFGYLDMRVGGSWTLTGTAQNSTGGKRKLALPIGYYSMRISNHSYLVKITEGETMVLSL
ncbi:MAG TPA: hypothetical protein VI461_16710 [Chitinophagaceae bacterium]|nr:hypothetical protein [Chitinophagaceae bacterium]